MSLKNIMNFIIKTPYENRKMRHWESIQKYLFILGTEFLDGILMIISDASSVILQTS